MAGEISFDTIKNTTHLMLAKKCDANGDGKISGDELSIFDACKKSFSGLSPEERETRLAQKVIEISRLDADDRNWAQACDLGQNPRERFKQDGKLTGREIKNFIDAKEPSFVRVGSVRINTDAVKTISKSDDEKYDYQVELENGETVYFTKQGANRTAIIDSVKDMGVWDTVIFVKGFKRNGQGNSFTINSVSDKITQVCVGNTEFDNIYSEDGKNRVFIDSARGKSSTESTVQADTTTIRGNSFGFNVQTPKKSFVEFERNKNSRRLDKNNCTRYTTSALRDVKASDVTVNSKSATKTPYDEFYRRICEKMKSTKSGNQNTDDLKKEISKAVDKTITKEEYERLLNLISMQQSTNSGSKY